MNRNQSLILKVLANDQIDEDEIDQIQAVVDQDGVLSLEDVELLVHLYCDAKSYSAKFEEMFFQTLRRAILADGKVLESERFYLLKMLYNDRIIRPAEIKFLERLCADAEEVPPELVTMIEDAKQAHPTDWDVGGKPGPYG